MQHLNTVFKTQVLMFDGKETRKVYDLRVAEKNAALSTLCFRKGKGGRKPDEYECCSMTAVNVRSYS